MRTASLNVCCWRISTGIDVRVHVALGGKASKFYESTSYPTGDRYIQRSTGAGMNHGQAKLVSNAHQAPLKKPS
jgi:hypothetical protein